MELTAAAERTSSTTESDPPYWRALSGAPLAPGMSCHVQVAATFASGRYNLVSQPVPCCMPRCRRAAVEDVRATVQLVKGVPTITVGFSAPQPPGCLPLKCAFRFIVYIVDRSGHRCRMARQQPHVATGLAASDSASITTVTFAADPICRGVANRASLTSPWPTT